MLVLRTSDKKRQSHNGFTYPERGPVSAPDWDPAPVCGGGLHGALRGEGSGDLFNWHPDAVWQVIEIYEYIDLDGKVKFPHGNVLYTGDRVTATNMIKERFPNAAVIGHTHEHPTNALAGYYGTAITHDNGIATAGDRGTALAGDGGTAISGQDGCAIAGQDGRATAGFYGQATAGYRGIAIAGNQGKATVGPHGHASAGERGVATADFGGFADAGFFGTIQIRYYDNGRGRTLDGYIGENGLLPGTPYRVRYREFVEA